MAISARIEPLQKDIELLIAQDLSPAAQSDALADFAIASLATAQQTNTEALGRRPAHQTFVDGRLGAAEETVRPNGTIVYEFDLLEEMFAWVLHQLQLHSPVKTGAYRGAHLFFADGVQADPLHPPRDIEQAVFLNTVPYARRVELGHSKQQPNGVYEVVTAMASRRFGNVARVQFGYRAAIGGSITGGSAGNKSGARFPAIIMTVR
jgi:hypothetical protein